MIFVLLGIALASATIAFTTMAADSAGGKKGTKLRHVVAFKFKETATPGNSGTK